MPLPLETSSDWNEYALILVDVQQDFWPEEVAEDAPWFLDGTTALLRNCRQLGIDVIHVHARFQPDQSDWIPRYRLRGRIPCVAGTPGAEPLPIAVPEPAEQVVVKQSFDAFLGTGLDEFLRGTGKRFLLVAGLVTSTCVLLTAATATQRGYLVTLVEDACADRQPFHDRTVRTYPFLFGTTRSNRLSQDRTDWDDQLRRALG